MTQPLRRPWRDLYRGVPPTLAPASETGLEMFRRTIAARPDAVLVHYFDQPITASRIDAMSDALAVALQQRGTAPGERIAMYLQNIPQVLIAVLAAWKCGAVIVPCNPMLRERELVKLLTDSGSRILICQEDLYGDVAHAALPAVAVQHTITTSPLDFLAPGGAVPHALAGISRVRHVGTSDLRDLVTRHTGEVP